MWDMGEGGLLEVKNFRFFSKCFKKGALLEVKSFSIETLSIVKWEKMFMLEKE